MKNEPGETNKSTYQIKLFIVLKQKRYKSESPPQHALSRDWEEQGRGY
jgi:hypothetical protein